ncbi:hypothetical protein B0H17DRAFT_1194727 [Mycena rosella]|uniref:Uncharacterized protein n=1 Tax=Mycena rosella TaxID=1033263 RepID=A0AAD7DXM6_MYCRO|nr:hypothetical protein B0H17DRAFT_1194727 [Mycena rosella]
MEADPPGSAAINMRCMHMGEVAVANVLPDVYFPPTPFLRRLSLLKPDFYFPPLLVPPAIAPHPCQALPLSVPDPLVKSRYASVSVTCEMDGRVEDG